MESPRYNLLVLVRNTSMTDRDIESEVEGLNHLLMSIDNNTGFCIAHELADRYRITSKPIKILQAIREEELKPFRFLINKN
ncbi:MAG TPA: hypothetical protein VLJ68_07635 [Chitinophagaceae bacterium]|nr:hypothetical protein [Chitinophagaceae bacterium]